MAFLELYLFAGFFVGVTLWVENYQFWAPSDFIQCFLFCTVGWPIVLALRARSR